MMEKEEVLQIVLKTANSFAEQNGVETVGSITADQRLIGKGGVFDSMDLVSFLVDLEEVLEEKYNRSFLLQDERAMSRSHSPFMNPDELSKFIIELNDDHA